MNTVGQDRRRPTRNCHVGPNAGAQFSAAEAGGEWAYRRHPWKAAVRVAADVNPDDDLPDWALGQAISQLVDGDDLAINDRASQLVHDFDDQRHDEDDDPDQGGEA